MIKVILLIMAASVLLAMIGVRLWTPPAAVLGLHKGRLQPCPASPNCVCSEYAQDSTHFIEPLPLQYPLPEAWKHLQAAIIAGGGEIQSAAPGYLYAIYRSRIFGFVDDLEVRHDAQQNVLQIRSASRLGHADFGVNRQRVEDLRTHYLDASSHATGV